MRRWLVILVPVVVALAIAFVVRPGEKEPEYEGKELSECVRLQQSEAAVQAIGRDAVPFLVKSLEYRMPAWRQAVFQFYERHPRFPGGARFSVTAGRYF